MSTKTYALTTGVIFLVVGVLHTLRLLFGTSVVIGGWPVPYWFNLFAVAVSTYLAYHGIRMAGR